MNKLFLLGIIATGFSAQVMGVCTFEPWEQYGDTPLLKHVDGNAYYYVSSHMGIDADGAPNAYHPEDVGLHCTRGEGFKGLDCPANAGYPKTRWWPSVLVADPNNNQQAYVQQEGDYAGFFVTQTTLYDPQKAPTDPARYVNASQIPYIVFPGKFHKKSGTGLMGDLGLAINMATNQQSAFVVADKGPFNADLGEISIALAQALGGNKPDPRTGAGKPEGDILYIVFPYSSRSSPWPMTAGEITQRSQTLLTEIGGIDGALACQTLP
ncbi:MAG: hypothetical protein ACJA13_004276 [Paraglaciecola sp.]|jgi:hypothetical protein